MHQLHFRQESCAATRKQHDAAAVLFGWSSATTFPTSIRLAKLRKLGFTATNIPYDMTEKFNDRW